MPQEIPQYLDPHNPLLATGPARLDLGSVDLPGVGKLAVVTVRTQSSTTTVMLKPEDFKNWVELINKFSDKLEGKTLQAATITDVAALDKASPFRKR